jgi:hypothetical protein
LLEVDPLISSVNFRNGPRRVIPLQRSFTVFNASQIDGLPLAPSKHPKEQGGGVSVTRFWKAGAVNYKAVPELKGVNLEAFRGKLREEVRVTAVV